jgi:hypothetical protein
MATVSPPSDAEILARVVAGRAARWSPEAARALLTLGFDRATTSRVRRLLQRNNRGTITADERLTLERFLRIGQLIDLLHARARRTLHESAATD